MAIDFMAATEALFDRIGPQELANAIGCSPQTIKQARMDEAKPGHRSPPPGWEAAAAKLAKQKADQFRRLAERLAGTT